MSTDPHDRLLERIARQRRRKPRLAEERVTLAHGAGGRATKSLIDAVFLDAFRNPALEPLEDAATLAGGAGPIAFTTDTYVVSPLFFPGGCIGDLAVNGTVNDLAVAGARPLWLSAGFVLEEGFPVDALRSVVAAMRAAANVAGVAIVTGDTKVVERGRGDGCYVNTAGIGLLERAAPLGAARARPGDAVLVSGPVGDHGVTILLARGDLEIEADLRSDTACLAAPIACLLDATDAVRCLRDATRGGVATVLNEIAAASEVGILAYEEAVPVRETVAAACELLGIDPLHVACEGRFVAVVGEEGVERGLAALRSHPLGGEARVIGRVESDPAGTVLLRTRFGGTRVLDMLIGDPLPRIC